MIVTMKKAFVVARRADRDRLIEALRRLGVVHIKPVDPARAAPDEATVAAIDTLGRAVQVLESVAVSGEPPALEPDAAAREVMRIQRETAERSARLATLHQQIEHLALWGEVRLDQFAAIKDAGIVVRFFAVPRSEVAAVKADCVEPVAPWHNKKVLVAVIVREGEPEVPEGCEEVPLPPRDRPAIRAEAARLDEARKADAVLLGRLSGLAPAMQARRNELVRHAEWTTATRSALADEHLYALQGWVPVGLAQGLASDLAKEGVEAAVECVDPAADEEPPTLIKYPWWAQPMKGLFDILGTVPGYREFDVAAMFMIFLPIFSAILISDAGYGVLYLVAGVVLRQKMGKKGMADLAHLIMVVGFLSVVWGVVTTSFFGWDFSRLLGLDGPFIVVGMQKESMSMLMRISITFGAVHLSLAHLWRAKSLFPKLECLAEIGWAVWLWGMYGLVRMFLVKDPANFQAFLHESYFPHLLLAGGVLAIVFAFPSRNPLKMLGFGLANFFLPMIGTFGDTVSYVRLMAIGLGGSALAVTFNNMAGMLPIYGTIPVMIVGHALNVALSIVSLLAHGVRLNMLEFSNNLGMQWSGYLYEPFSEKR